MDERLRFLLYGTYDGFSRNTLGADNILLVLDNGDKVEIPKHFVKNASDFVEKNKIKLKDVTARIKQLDIGTRKVWLDEFLNELGSDYGTLKYKAGYEQGKLEGEWVGQQLKPEAGHADEAPRYVKNILARLRELPLHDREVWLKAIMGEFEQDFSRAKWREGYEQGKVEGLIEREKVTIPQFVAELIEEARTYKWDLDDLFEHISEYSGDSEVSIWFYTLGNIDVLARAWLDGYTVEEKRYRVKMKGMDKDFTMLKLDEIKGGWYLGSDTEFSYTKNTHTRKELEQAGFGEVFDSPLFEVEEVE